MKDRGDRSMLSIEVPRRRVLPALLFLSLLAVMKGMHRPDRWGSTQMETDYSAGFIKRGLFGELLRRLHVDHYNQLVVIATVAVLILVVQLAWYAFRRLSEQTGSPLPGAVFLTSFALTYLVSLTGHLEIFLAVLALLALSIRNTRMFLTAALVVTVLGLMMHELFFFVFLPTLALRGLLDGWIAEDGRVSGGRWRGLGAPAVLVLVALATTLFLSLRASMTAEQIVALRQSLIGRLDFAPREWVFAIFSRSALDNLDVMRPIWHGRRYWILQVESLLMFGPAMVFFLILTLRRLHTVTDASTRRFLQLAAAGTSLSPLLLHVFGFDISRFNALATLNCFLVAVLVFAGTRPLAPADGWSMPRRSEGAAIFLIALNLGTGIGLLDDQPVKLFPQFQSLAYAVHDIADILHHRPLPLPYEPWLETRWDPAHPKLSSLKCLDTCGEQPLSGIHSK